MHGQYYNSDFFLHLSFMTRSLTAVSCRTAVNLAIMVYATDLTVFVIYNVHVHEVRTSRHLKPFCAHNVDIFGAVNL